jgi:hypothetical protein
MIHQFKLSKEVYKGMTADRQERRLPPLMPGVSDGEGRRDTI